MRTYRSLESNKRTVRDIFFLLAIAVALGLGLALTSPALGAGLHGTLRQAAGGNITGSVSVSGGNPAGITVELRQRSNGGEDKTLATTTTDAQGNYHFAGQASAPNDAFYYMKFSGGKGTLSAWFSFPIIYLSGSDFTVPTVEMSDVQLLLPAGSSISLPSSLQWKARRSGETYRVFIYAQGDNSKVALDSGSLGMSTDFPLGAGALPEGNYEAVVQVRDAVVGYGQSQARFQFTVGKSVDNGTGQPTPELGVGGSAQSPAQPTAAQPVQPGQPEAAVPTAIVAPTSEPEAVEPAPAVVPSGSPSLQVDLSANRSEVQQGDSMIYKIEVTNKGDGMATGVVVTDHLPNGLAVDSSTTRSTHGSIAVEGNNVTVQVGELAPSTKAVVEIPVSVGKDAGANVSNQAVAQYQGAPAPVNSNAYVAQVASPPAAPPAAQPQSPAPANPQVPPSNPPQSQPQAPATNPSSAQPEAPANSQPANPPASQPAQPPASQPASPPQSQPQAPATNPSSAQQQTPPQKKPAAPIPQTGGGFPVVLALLILFVTLVARYLRGRTRSYRRT